ncbi:uncharacterized protein LTR77_004036 [Saxophila tyrrhenica]|uniref:Dienelactone hydrolase domain-containing protein n=1 Tax=Saxophila tyrrhenica TaxID=1690608 RepID=A0AAV9PEY4_9PEZI|nr:hypothetical protein LTR77_004036 [Saxophila tyrrhenica]
MSRGDQPAEPQWLAKPSGACCLKYVSMAFDPDALLIALDRGHLHNGDPKGLFERLADIETYVTKPSAEKDNGHIVFYFPDVFGFFTNGLLVCDTFAEAGYTTIGIDYFSGDPIYMHRDGPKEPKEGFDFEAWLAKHNKFAVENVNGWISAVKQKYGKSETKYACVGHHFENIQRPLFLSCAESDFTFETDARNKALSILREAKKPYSLQLFSGVEHGFALRCNLDVADERWAKEESARGIASYFDLKLGLFEKQGKDAKL